MTYRMNAFWEWFYGTPAGYFSMEKSANMYIVHTKFIPQNCQCAQVYPVHRCRKIFRIQYRTWNLVNKINALYGHWSTDSLAKWPSQAVPTILVLKTWVGLWPCKKRSKIWVAKSRVQKTRPLLFKKRRGQAASSLFE